MSASSSSIKTLCEELITSNNNDDNLGKTLGKLLNILKISEKFQKEVFINLSDKGISKIMLTMKNDNIELRKISGKLLIELLNNNEVLQNIFCEKFNFNPIGNIICLNWFPKILKENLNMDGSIINDIKSSKYQSKSKFWIWPYNPKYNDEIFPDPQKYLIGFYYSNKAAYVIPNNTVENVQTKETIKSIINKLEKRRRKRRIKENK